MLSILIKKLNFCHKCPFELPFQIIFISTMAENQAESDSSSDDIVIPNEEKTFFDSKLFRWISVFLYLGGISGMGMVLFFYYILFFDSRMPDIHLKFPVSIGGHPVQKVQVYQ